VLAYVTNNVNSPAFKLNSVFNYFKVFNYFNTSTIQIVAKKATIVPKPNTEIYGFVDF